MNEFEWRRQLRDLRQPATPGDDLWARIDQALDASSAAAPGPLEKTSSGANPARPGPSRRHWLAMGVAAALVVVAFSWRPPRVEQGPALTGPGDVVAHSAWKPADPRLSGAAVELEAARLELSQALQQAPHSAGLQQLLEHTDQQQNHLRQLEHENG